MAEVHGGNPDRDLAAAVAADGENAVAVAGVADTVVVAAVGAESVEGYEGHCTSL